MKKKFNCMVLCTLTLIISLCLCFNVSAATTLSTLTADDLSGTQAPTAITENLTLPEIDGTWSSSNTAVISDTGVVTRPVAEDAEVTMTATPTEGESVSFNFTVKAQTKKILACENFAAYAELTNANHDTNIFNSMTNWANSTSTGSHIVKDAAKNNYLEVGFDQNPATGHTMRWNISPNEKVVYFDVQFKRDETGMPFNLQAYFSAEVDGETAQKLARLATIYNGRVYWGNNGSGKYVAYTLGSWHSLSFKIDMDTLKTYGSLDGGDWTEVDMLASYGGNFNSTNVSINYMQRIHFALNSNPSTNVMLDNLVLSADAPPLSLISIDDLAGTQAPTAITTNLTLPEIDGTWSSSNTSVISDTGVVTRPLAEDAKVTMTATPDEGESVSFNFTVKAKNKKVIAQDNFNYSGLGSVQGTTSFYTTMGNDWAISAAAPNSRILTDSNSNQYLEADMSAGNTQLFWYKAAEGDVIYLNFDAMRANAGNTVALQAYVTGEDAAGNAVTRLLRLALFYDGKIYWGNNANSTGMAAVDTGVLKPVAFKIDLINKKICGSYNNGEFTEVDSTNTTYGTAGSGHENQLLATDTITGLSYIRFLAQSSGADNIMIDNIVLSTDEDEEQGGGETPGEGGGETPGEGGGETPGEGGEDLPSDDEVQDTNVEISTDENGTIVTYTLSDIAASESAVLVAALINTATSNVNEINWTVCEDISLIEGDPKKISVSLTGTESDTVKLHYYLCNNLNDLYSLKDFAPAEPDLKTVAADISTADITWAAPDDDYESSSALRYNIYDDGLLINETPVSALNYNAQNLVPGADYHFFVKALDSKNNESNVSNMIKGSTYMPSTITTRIKAKDDTEVNGSPSKDGNLVFGPLPSNADTNLFYYKQDRTGGLNCFSSAACYQSTATGTPNYIRGISYLAFWLKNAVNADNVKYAYEFTYYDQHEETGKDANLTMTYQTTRGRKSVNVKLTNDKAWKTVKGIFTAEKPLSPIGDKNAGESSQIFFGNSHAWNSDWSEDRPTSGSLVYENLYDEDYTKIYRMTLIPLVDGAEETYENYRKLAGASLTIENPAQGEAATIISGLDSNAKGFNSDSEDKPLSTKDGRLAVALAKLNDKLTFTVTDTAVAGKAGNIELCCFAEEETIVTLSNGSSKKIPANTWTKLRFAQDSVASSEYKITANNELYVSSLRVTAK